MNNYIPLSNLVFLSPYHYLQTKFFPVDLWPKGVGHKSTGKTRNGNLQYRLRKTRSVRYYYVSELFLQGARKGSFKFQWVIFFCTESLNNKFHIIRTARGRIAWDRAPWQGKKGKKRGEKECKNNLQANKASQAGDQGKGKDAFSFPPKSSTRLAWLAFFFELSILFFALYPTKEPGSRLGEEFN